jgi:uncharacterized protein DUF6090
MIRFFRRIRLKSFGDNKIGKYLIYAIGEIILVVIGILMALQINNWNQQRLAEVKINRLLLEIKKSLTDEIEIAERGVKFYYQKDSLIKRIKEKKVTKQEFTAPTRRSPQYALLTYYNGFSLNRNAYENLVQMSDKIPVKYDTLYSDLKTLYKGGGGWIEERKTKLLDKFYPFQEYLRENKEWWSDIFQFKELNGSAIQYFLYDPIYLNWVYEIHDDMEQHQESLNSFKKAATDINKQILELEINERKANNK